jgi:hypothetical protein
MLAKSTPTQTSPHTWINGLNYLIHYNYPIMYHVDLENAQAMGFVFRLPQSGAMQFLVNLRLRSLTLVVSVYIRFHLYNFI